MISSHGASRTERGHGVKVLSLCKVITLLRLRGSTPTGAQIGFHFKCVTVFYTKHFCMSAHYLIMICLYKKLKIEKTKNVFFFPIQDALSNTQL